MTGKKASKCGRNSQNSLNLLPVVLNTLILYQMRLATCGGLSIGDHGIPSNFDLCSNRPTADVMNSPKMRKAKQVEKKDKGYGEESVTEAEEVKEGW